MAQTATSSHGTYGRLSWYDKNSFLIGLFLVCGVLFIAEVFLCIMFAVRRVIMKRKGIAPICGIVKTLSRFIMINSLLNLMFYGISMMTWGNRLRYGMPLDAKLLLLIPIISSLITVVLAVGSLIVWKKKAGSLFFRINISVVAIVCTIFVWFYNYWNLFGFKY